MTITQPLAIRAAYQAKQFVNKGQTQTPDVIGAMATPPTTMVEAAAVGDERATGFGTNDIARASKYVKGATPVTGTVSAKVACCTPSQDFLRDFYDAASTFGGTVPSDIIP